MMKRFKLLFLSAVMITGCLTFTACGMGGNDNSEAPYEDETNKDVNNGNNNTIGDDIKDGVDNVGDVIEDGVNGIENGIENGIDDMQNDTENKDTHNNNTENNTENNGATGTSSLKDAGKNLMDSIQKAGIAIKDGIDELTNNER